MSKLLRGQTKLLRGQTKLLFATAYTATIDFRDLSLNICYHLSPREMSKTQGSGKPTMQDFVELRRCVQILVNKLLALLHPLQIHKVFFPTNEITITQSYMELNISGQNIPFVLNVRTNATRDQIVWMYHYYHVDPTGHLICDPMSCRHKYAVAAGEDDILETVEFLEILAQEPEFFVYRRGNN